MAPILYMVHGSPPVRAVLMTAKAIGLNLTEKEIDFFQGEHRKPAYLKLNPQHTVPTLDDDGFTIWDSHAIMAYLVSKYAKNDALYPKDLQKRAIVDQRLHFESGVVFARLAQITKPILLDGRTTIQQEDKDNIIEAYAFLESFLEGRKWVAGDFVSIADYSLVSSVGSINTLIPIDAQKFPNVTAWLKRAEGLPEYEVNKKGQQIFYELLSSRLSKESGKKWTASDFVDIFRLIQHDDLTKESFKGLREYEVHEKGQQEFYEIRINMAPILYTVYASPPVRAVLMTAKAIGLTLNIKEIEFFGGERLTPEFHKVNPQHTVPTLVDDDGFAIWDSHAIITYLVSKYAKDDALYPKDVQKRAIVDQRLYFESGVMFERVFHITRAVLFDERTTIHQEEEDNIIEAYGFLESFLERKKWVAGDFVSVADYSLVSSVSSINTLISIDAQKFSKVTAWLKRAEGLPGYAANKLGLERFTEYFGSKLSKL